MRALCERDPVAACLIESRIDSRGLSRSRLGAEVWGHGWPRLESVCFAGANLVPLFAGKQAVRAFADRARRQGRRCSSIVGPAESVLPLWQLLETSWSAARDIRPNQPLMSITAPPLVTPDPLVRRVREDELDIVLPACIAMFTEEVGISPLGPDGGTSYRTRVRDLIRAGRAFARIDDGRVVYKAELGAVSNRVAQVQGVWVNPELRGRGHGSSGTAAVVAQTLRSVAPVVSLYVNDYNQSAKAAYRRVGFTQVGTFASVLF